MGFELTPPFENQNRPIGEVLVRNDLENMRIVSRHDTELHVLHRNILI